MRRELFAELLKLILDAADGASVSVRQETDENGTISIVIVIKAEQ